MIKLWSWTGHVARMREKKGAYRVSVEKRTGKSSLARPRSTREGNIKTDLQKWRYGLMCVWIGTGGGILNAVMNLRVP